VDDPGSDRHGIEGLNPNGAGATTSSRERFLAALNGERPDRVPLAHVSALTNMELQEATGCYMPAVHLDPESLVRLCWANHELLGFDAVTFILNYFNEPAALGSSMNWGDPQTLPVYSSHPWKRSEDAVIPGDLLDRPPVSTYLQALRIAKKRYGQKVAVLGKVMGPFSMAQVMHGVENVMLGLTDDTERIRGFLEVCVEVLVLCANAQFEEGIDALAIGEGGAGANMLSPEMYAEVLLEVHKKLVRAIQGPTIMHICGDITPRLKYLRQVGLRCFNFDWAVDPKLMKQAAGGSFAIMGNINTTDLLTGSPEVIEAQAFANLEAGVDIISPGCAISPLCPSRNLGAMAAAIEKWAGNRD
jgi:MtaA/CmuA family methyltransferase